MALLLEASRKLALRPRLCWRVFWQRHTTAEPVLKRSEQIQCLPRSGSPWRACGVRSSPSRPAPFSATHTCSRRCSSNPVTILYLGVSRSGVRQLLLFCSFVQRSLLGSGEGAGGSEGIFPLWQLFVLPHEWIHLDACFLPCT